MLPAESRRRVFLTAVLIAFGAVPGFAAPPKPKPIWLVVTRPMFAKSIKPLADHRRKDGFEVIVSTSLPPEAIKACPRKPDFVLLVGDDEVGEGTQPWYLPSVRVKQYCWDAKQPKSFASDAIYGDLDGDRLPDIPVGRFPVRTVGDAELLVRKIIQYESRPPGLEDLGFLVWAGSAEYGPILDRLATPLLLNIIRTHAPPWTRPVIITGQQDHVLSGWPPDQPGYFNSMLSKGPGLTCMIGHGYSRLFFSMGYGKGVIGYIPEFAKLGLKGKDPISPVLILSCQCGMFAEPEPCLAEEMLLLPGGPVAMIAATANTHPVPNFYTGQGVLQAARTPKRLGELWLCALKGARTARNPMMERILSNAENAPGKRIDLRKLLDDQSLLYALLGDPATKLRIPHPLHGNLHREADGWRWSVKRPVDATKLHVSFRPAGQKLPAPPKDRSDRKATHKAFKEANRTFDFQPIVELDANKPWEGTVDKEGVLRLVAIGPKRMYAAAIRLKRPTTTTSAPLRSGKIATHHARRGNHSR